MQELKDDQVKAKEVFKKLLKERQDKVVEVDLRVICLNTVLCVSLIILCPRSSTKIHWFVSDVNVNVTGRLCCVMAMTH